MATIRKNVPWSFLTNLTPVATNTAFGTTTTHTFGPIDVELETSRVVKSAWLEITVDTAFTAAADVDGFEVGIEVNGGGATTQQYTLTAPDTGENERLVICHDVTSELIAGLDPGETQSIEASISVVSESVQNVTGHTATLWIEYECDNDGATYYTYVDIMIQSHHTIIADTFVEIGVSPSATGGADAPSNQIPQLTGAGGLLDNGLGLVAIHQLKLHLFCRAGDNTTTDQTLRLSLDGGVTENSRATNEQALGHRLEWWDIVDLQGADTNMTLTTTASAALHAANTTATNGFEGLGGFVRVVYEVDPANATRDRKSVV